MPENVVWYESVLKWGSMAVAGLIGIIWIKNEKRFEDIEKGVKLKADNSKVDVMFLNATESRNTFQKHLLLESKEHEKFVTHDYLEKELKPLIDGIGKRTDKQLEKVDEKLEKIMSQTADVIKRDEYTADNNRIYSKIDGKQDKH